MRASAASRSAAARCDDLEAQNAAYRKRQREAQKPRLAPASTERHRKTCARARARALCRLALHVLYACAFLVAVAPPPHSGFAAYRRTTQDMWRNHY